MKNLIKILPNIYGVKVPMVASDFNKRNYDLYFDPMPLNLDISYDILNIGFDFKILGTITATEISFDASDVVENLSDVEEIPSYKFHEKREGKSAICFNKEQSFRSALDNVGIYFENPVEKPKEEHGFDQQGEPIFYGIDKNKLNKWQTAQENITHKLLILQKL